jgi:hypothetical protein
VRITLTLSGGLLNPAHQRIRRFSLGATTSNSDAERITRRLLTQRTKTIEFTSYPRPRHRTPRDESRFGPPSDMNPNDPTTSVFGTDCDGVLFPVLTREFTDSSNRI